MSHHENLVQQALIDAEQGQDVNEAVFAIGTPFCPGCEYHVAYCQCHKERVEPDGDEWHCVACGEPTDECLCNELYGEDDAAWMERYPFEPDCYSDADPGL